MSERMKQRLINQTKYIEIVIGIPGKEEVVYKIPNTSKTKERLKVFLKELTLTNQFADKESIPWESLAADRISQYTEAGLALRGARYRRGLTQKQVAEKCGISQENLSRMEKGKRVIGKRVAKKLAKVLLIDERLLGSSAWTKKSLQTQGRFKDQEEK